MAYTPTAYTTVVTVKRILRTANDKIRIGDEVNSQVSTEDVEDYILDASRIIDSTIVKFLNYSEIPLTTTYPEISFAAPRITAYLIYRDLQQGMEDLPIGPKGWLDEAEKYIKIFTDNVDAGVYPDISVAKNGPKWETAQQTFQNLIGVSVVNDQIPNVDNQVPINTENLGPYTDS